MNPKSQEQKKQQENMLCYVADLVHSKHVQKFQSSGMIRFLGLFKVTTFW